MFELIKNKDIKYFKITEFETYGIKAIFSTKISGFSNYSKNSLNLGLNTNDSFKNVEKNFYKFFNYNNIDIKNVVPADQVHKDNIAIINSYHKTSNFLFNKNKKNTDAIITNEKDIVLISFYADCVPLYFCDKKNKIIGLAHSGWKGTILEIGRKVIEKMNYAYNSNPKDILVGIGPSIGPNNFEVSLDVAIKFKKYKTVKKIKNKYFVDLWLTNYIILQNAGILKNNIIMSNLDTYENKELFFSYRRDKGNTGRMISCIYFD
ncbi:laccase domain protein [Tepiditoga spiralis]|uniref:Purine nucleoside phosphorylase n=1 Tax=Tepiditoga spiralis TaxID=2108365 RepID=A0A7G1G8N6_9BACT|nr:peptidoglycan editing factor PgeF [Tepiditoga spiralis]BBE31327.1 laccase domain protein [Tepiditoga spiralis]